MRKFFILGLGILSSGSVIAAGVRINEIAWMGTTISANDEWIELYNANALPIDLTGWTLSSTDGAPAISLSGVIGATDFWLLERTDDDSVLGVFADQIYTGGLDNGGEELALRDVAGDLIDSVQAGAWIGGENTTKQTLVRLDDGSW